MTLHIAVTRRNCYYTTRASVYISSLRYFSMSAYHGKEQNFDMPAYVIFCNLASIFYVPAGISYILASISYISGLRYFSLLAHQVIKWYLESQVFQYAGISWQEQNFSMPTYHGKSKVSVCQHIMARAKFQYASISWHRPKSPITVYFGLPAYQGIYQ
jgi:hypothetical protein